MALVPPIAALSLLARSSTKVKFELSTIPRPADTTIFESSNCGPDFSSINISNTSGSSEFTSTVSYLVLFSSTWTSSKDLGLIKRSFLSEVTFELYSLSPPFIELEVMTF